MKGLKARLPQHDATACRSDDGFGIQATGICIVVSHAVSSIHPVGVDDARCVIEISGGESYEIL